MAKFVIRSIVLAAMLLPVSVASIAQGVCQHLQRGSQKRYKPRLLRSGGSAWNYRLRRGFALTPRSRTPYETVSSRAS